MNQSRNTEPGNKLSSFVLLLTLFIVACTEKESVKIEETSINNYGFVKATSRQSPYLEDSLTYAFIQEINLINQHNIPFQYVSNQSYKGLNFGDNENVSENFSLYVDPSFLIVDEADSAFYVQQVNYAENKLWDMKHLGIDSLYEEYTDWCFENPNFDWNSFRNNNFGCLVDIGIPLFNLKKDVAIIYVGWQCHYTFGSGDLFRYKKVNGRWVLDEKVNLWMS